MNMEDRLAAEDRVADWLNESAPTPANDLAARLLLRTRTLPQRNEGGIRNMFAMRAIGVAAVVVAAIVAGVSVSRVVGPPPVGTQVPVETSPSPTSSPAQSEAVSTPSPESPTATPSPASQTPTSPPASVNPGRIAFQANRADETSGIYVMDADGSNVVQVVDNPSIHEMDPVWSPDGSMIAYITLSADGSLEGGVFIVDAAGGESVQVDDAYPYAPAVWSPDGSMLAIGGDGGTRGIGVYDVAASRLDQLTDDGGTAPLWSPDGSQIAYTAAVPNDIRVVAVATGETRDVTTDEWNDSLARWTDDGTQLIFVSDRDTDQAKGSERTWVVNADGGEPELLGEPVLAFAHWSSPDGEWLVYAAEDGSGLRLSRADGSEDRAVHPMTPADQGPSWASDSSAFVFSNTGEAPRNILLMRVDARAPEQLTDDPADESAPNWEPAGG